MNLKTITASPALPVGVDLAKSHLKIQHDLEDDLFAIWIDAARERVEIETESSIVEQEYELRIAAFAKTLLPRGPVQSIDSIEYYDLDNTLQTLASSEYYLVDDCVVFDGLALPSLYDREDAIVITYTAGPTEEDGTPSLAQLAVLLLVGVANENREAVAPIELKNVPQSYQAIITNLRREITI